jgi:hypothetical protein
MKHLNRCLSEMQRRGATEVEVRGAAQASFVRRMRERLGSSVFVRGSCQTANSYYFNQHGESPLLRPTPTAEGLWSAAHYPLADYAFAS